MRATGVVLRKELRDSLRDRRTLLTALIFGPIFGPVLFVILFATTMAIQFEAAEAPLELPVVGSEHAPNLVQFLRQQGVEILEPPPDPELSIAREEYDVILRIDASFSERWRDGSPAPVELLTDRSRREVGTTLERVSGVLRAYGSQVGRLRLVLRGIDPVLAQPLQLREVDLSTPESRGALVLGMLPYFLMMGVFVSGTSIAIDTTAGERERRSLEPLLINPVPRWELVTGKLLATTVFTLASLALTLLSFLVGVGFIPADTLDMTLNLNAALAALMWLVTAPVSLIAAALLVMLASFAKTYREAQSYMGLVVFIPILPTLWLFISPMKPALWMMSLPLMSQSVIIIELISGRSMPLGWLLLSIASSLVLGLLLAALATRLYRQPRLS